MHDLEANRGFKFKAESERGTITSKQQARASQQPVGGILPILDSDLERIMEKVKQFNPDHPHPLHSVAEESAKNRQKAVERAQANAEAEGQEKAAADSRSTKKSSKGTVEADVAEAR